MKNESQLSPLIDNLEAIQIKDSGYVFVGLENLDKPAWYWALLGRIVVLAIVGYSLWYYQFESLIMSVGTRDCIVLMGDFNSRLSRNIDRRVGRWCIHNKRDSGGDRLLAIMNYAMLTCFSTYFQPRRNHNNATYMNIQTDKAPSQIDYIIMSSRWASAARDCKCKWGISIKSYGRTK